MKITYQHLDTILHHHRRPNSMNHIVWDYCILDYYYLKYCSNFDYFVEQSVLMVVQMEHIHLDFVLKIRLCRKHN